MPPPSSSTALSLTSAESVWLVRMVKSSMHSEDHTLMFPDTPHGGEGRAGDHTYKGIVRMRRRGLSLIETAVSR